jgi:hypothetical protein
MWLLADPLADVVHAVLLDHAVGAREVDVLEDAEAPPGGRERLDALHAALAAGDDLARLHVAHVSRADDVERAGLAGQDGRALELAEHQRPDAQRIAHADHARGGERDEAIRALDLPKPVDQPVEQRAVGARGDQVDDDLGVHGGLEDAAALDQFAPEARRIGQVAVMPDGEAAGGELREQRLHVAQHGVAGGGVAVVADRGMAVQPADHRLAVQVVADLSEAAMGMELPAVERDDAAGFLSPMLQGVQAERGERRGVGRAPDAENAAFLVQLVVVEGVGGERSAAHQFSCWLRISRSICLRWSPL